MSSRFFATIAVAPVRANLTHAASAAKGVWYLFFQKERPPICLPTMQCFKPKNLVRIRIRIRIRGNDGKPRIVYLGPCGSEQARQRHEQLIAEYLTWQDQPETASVTINRLCVALREHAHWYYFKDGEVAAEVSAIRCSLRPLIELYGRQIVADFGPKKLILLREQMIEPA